MAYSKTDAADSANYVIGSGYIYFEEEDSSGDIGTGNGERYLGDTPGFALSLASDIIEIESSDAPVAENLIAVTKKLTRAGSLGLRNIIPANLAIFVSGAVSTVTQSATPVASEAITVTEGSHHQIGQSSSNPTGVHGLTLTSVKDVTDVTTYVAGTDYECDTASGMLYIIVGGGISTDDVIHVNYTPTSNSRNRIASSGTAVKRGALHFVADNTVGDPHHVYIPRVELAPNGELNFKSRDNEIAATFDLNILTRTGYSQVYIDDTPV